MSIRRPGDEAVIETALLGLVRQAGRRGIAAEHLVERARLEPEVVAESLERLSRRGEAVEWRGRWLVPRHADLIVGTIQALRGGDALLRAGADEEASFFVPRQRLGEARDGDTVLARRAGGRRRRAASQLPEASVVGVLARRWKTLVGTLRTEAGRRLLVPFDARLEWEVVVRGPSPDDDTWVVVGLDEGGGRPGTVVGRVVEVLGDLAEPGVDVKVVLRHYCILESFPAAVVEQARNFPADPGSDDLRGREDLRAETIVTIDGETARDFDDAISVERAEGGGFRLGVHIADVSHYVREGTPLDVEAYRRGTSVYFPERAVPMLPEGLSNGLCSLKPDAERLTFSAFLDIDGTGRVRKRRFAETVIRSARRLTYAGVRRILEEPRAEDAAELGEVLGLLRRAGELMRLLHQVRRQRGSIDFDLPEGDVVLDTDGVVVGVRPSERHVAHRIIEEFMIAANEAVAEELSGHQCPGLHRVHAPPSPTALSELRSLLRTFGLELEGDLASLHPGALQRVLDAVAGRPEEPLVSTVILRSMQRALYSPEDAGHYALASRHYTHFTSPIRRYPDLLVHRRLRALLRGTAEEEARESSLEPRLESIGEHCSFTERRAERAERDLLQWKKVRFLSSRVGERFLGRITGVQPFGLFVQLDEYFVDGLVPTRTLGDDFYAYEPESHRLVGSGGGRVFRLADPVEVVLHGVDARRRGLELRIADLPEGPAQGARAGARARGAERRRRAS